MNLCNISRINICAMYGIITFYWILIEFNNFISFKYIIWVYPICFT